MHGDYTRFLKEQLTPAPTEGYILQLILKDVRKNGAVIQYDNIAFKAGVPCSIVEAVVENNLEVIQKEIKKSPFSTTNFPCVEKPTYVAKTISAVSGSEDSDEA